MNKRIKWILILCVAVGAVVWLRADRAAAPDQKLVAHLDSLCEIARKHVESPKAGVGKVFRYLGKHSPAMLHQFGELLVEIERISNDERHDARARKAAKRFRRHADRCEPIMEKFWTAVDRDPEASRLAARGAERLGRTLDILFGGQNLRSLYRESSVWMGSVGR